MPAHSFEDVSAAEREYLCLEPDQPVVGLAISGGGIRSAAFGLGILQALVKEDLLEKFDYLSTVSGGGYIGSALTWFLEKGLPDGQPAGVKATNFPLGQYRSRGARADGDGQSNILNFIRQHGNYLTPGRGLDGTSLAAVTLRTMLVHLLFYFMLVACGMVLLLLFFPSFKPPAAPTWTWEVVWTWAKHNLALQLAAILAAAFVVFSLVYSMCTRIRFGPSAGYAARVLMQRWFGRLLALAAALLVLGTLPIVGGLLGKLLGALSSSALALAGGALAARGQSKQLNAAAKEEAPSSALALLAAVLLVYGLLLGAYAAAWFLSASAPPGTGWRARWS